MKTLNAKSFWIKGKNDSYIKSHNVSLPKKGEVLIETIYSGISYGTEKVVYTGSVPKSQLNLMRCPHQEGNFGTDVKYGYMNIGKVIQGAPKFKGKFVYTLYPHQTLYVLKESDISLIPKAIPSKRCLLTANMETVINAMWDTLPTCGDNIFILGGGIVGFLMAYVLKSIIGIDITLIDKDQSKSKYAKLFNIKFMNELPKNDKANIIYECTGNPEVVNKLSNLVKEEATICILSWYGDKVSKINFGEDFLSKRIKFVFSQVSKVSHNRSKYWDNILRRELAIKLLNDKKLDKLIEKKEIKFNDLPKFFKNINKHENFFCKVINYKER